MAAKNNKTSTRTQQKGGRERVYNLAKRLGMSSKDVVVALNAIGLVKVAQSSLTEDEIKQLTDYLDGQTEQEAAEEEDRIRDRVRKNVANEIHQIEEKVEADLADIMPEITPAPDTPGAVEELSPIFVAPTGQKKTSVVDEPEEPEVVEEDGEEDEEELPTEPVALKGSARLEAKRRRRNEMRETGRKKSKIVSQAEFLARRESVERTMVVRERHHIEDPTNPALITQVGVLEDDLLVEHFVTSEAQASIVGNIYLGRVQNVLPSMEAAFIDIGMGRNGVLYASEVDWQATGLRGRGRRIEQALKSGDQVLVQVSKDPVGHKGARLTTQISLAGRYLVYVPGGRSAGISRKLPVPERKRLKDILARVIPGEGGAIIRTAAENVPEEAIARDVNRLHGLWEDINARSDEEKASKGAKPVTLYEEPDMLVKVVRDIFNEDFTRLVVEGERAWRTVKAYVDSVAPDLADRLEKYHPKDHDGQDVFASYRVDEQLQKALHRKVWLPSGGSLVIDRTEAMTVIDVNTGKFTGSGGNLEETVTRNNLEAAEEIVRQLRLRDIGGMIVVDFIDMVLPENQDLVLRRLKEALGRDRTRHQVSEVTSLGLVQMTRKRLGTGLLETFSTPCETCGGRGLILHSDPVDHTEKERTEKPEQEQRQRKPKREEKPQRKQRSDEELEEIAASVVRVKDDKKEEDTQEQNEESRPPRRRATRGRRGRSRGRGNQPALQETSYEQELKEFEESPRRKRKTRGNSRSDHRPEQPAAQQKEETRQASPSTRRRRRVVRKMSSEQAPQPTQPKRQEETSQTSAPKGRRRRRATRKRSN